MQVGTLIDRQKQGFIVGRLIDNLGNVERDPTERGLLAKLTASVVGLDPEQTALLKKMYDYYDSDSRQDRRLGKGGDTQDQSRNELFCVELKRLNGERGMKEDQEMESKLGQEKYVKKPLVESAEEVFQLEADADVEDDRVPRAKAGRTGMTATKTTKVNKSRVKNIAAAGIPILLEGGTGVGKSATVNQAALETMQQEEGKEIDFEQEEDEGQRIERRLIRYNLSRNTTIDELLGQMKMDEGRFELQLQPFAEAFKNGHWLLLDEMNLAQDMVLQ
eukprot:2165008-Prymnesium_polylepis.1